MTANKYYTYKITRREVKDKTVTVQVSAAEMRRLRNLPVRERAALWQGLAELPACENQARTYTKWLSQHRRITK